MSDPLVYWFCFGSAMIVPVIILAGSSILRTVSESDPNNAVGFRTRLSMSSQEAWSWANLCCARVWKKMGLVMLAASATAMLAFSWLAGTGLVVFVTVLSGLQMLCMVLSILYVQKRLRSMFQPDGTARNPAESGTGDK